MEKTKIYDVVKEIAQTHYNNGDNKADLAKWIAEDISLAIKDVYGKGGSAKEILNDVSYRVQAWCNPVFN